MFLRKKIPCYVLIFSEYEIIKKSLSFLADYSSQLDIIVIENPSPSTPKIKRLVDGFGKKGLVKRYYLFDHNITGNAYDTVLNIELEQICKSKYVLVSDGDLISEDSDWLKEEIDILSRHKDVFACGASLDRSNLPIKAFPDAENWIPPDINVCPDYYEAYTGGHLLMFRGKEFYEFMIYKNKNKLNFVDGQMHKYCYEILGKKWARTKRTKLYHLTWDLYNDKSNPYTKMKTNKSFTDTWYHKDKAKYKLKSY